MQFWQMVKILFLNLGSILYRSDSMFSLLARMLLRDLPVTESQQEVFVTILNGVDWKSSLITNWSGR